MLIIDPDVRSTYDFRFRHAVRTGKNVSAYQLHDKGRMGDVPFSKGDWLVKDRGHFKIVPRREFGRSYNIAGVTSERWDRRRIPAMVGSDDVDTEEVGCSSTGAVVVRRVRCEKGTYFFDAADGAFSRLEAPLAYIVFQDLAADGFDGVTVEEVLLACMDHLERQRERVPPSQFRQLNRIIRNIQDMAVNAAPSPHRREHARYMRRSDDGFRRESAATGSTSGCSGCGKKSRD